MATVCPTVLAQDTHDFREQLERVEPFAERIQIDLTDGYFAPVKTIALEKIHWPKGMVVDLHLMFGKPVLSLREIVELKPHLVIVHAEASGNLYNFSRVLHKFDIKVGLALLPPTSIEEIAPAIEYLDHILIFSGDLGHFGGTADLELLQKVQAVKALKPGIEVGWDGGVNDENIAALANGGVDVLNVGGFIQKASNPAEAYAKLKGALQKK